MRISDWSSDVCSSDLFPSHDIFPVLVHTSLPIHNLCVLLHFCILLLQAELFVLPRGLLCLCHWFWFFYPANKIYCRRRQRRRPLQKSVKNTSTVLKRHRTAACHHGWHLWQLRSLFGLLHLRWHRLCRGHNTLQECRSRRRICAGSVGVGVSNG